MFQKIPTWLLIADVLIWAFALCNYTLVFFVFGGVRHLSPSHAMMLCLLGVLSLGMLTACVSALWMRRRR